MPKIDFKAGDRYQRKYLVTIAKWTVDNTDYTEILGVRTEDSSIEFNMDSETTTDIRGISYTDVNKTEPQQDFDPYFIRNDSDLGRYLATAALKNDYNKYNGFDIYIVAMFLDASGKYSSSITEESTSGEWYTVKHENSSIIPTSLGGDSYVNMPIEVHFSNKITEGTVNKIAESFTFTPKGTTSA